MFSLCFPSQFHIFVDFFVFHSSVVILGYQDMHWLPFLVSFSLIVMPGLLCLTFPLISMSHSIFKLLKLIPFPGIYWYHFCCILSHVFDKFPSETFFWQHIVVLLDLHNLLYALQIHLLSGISCILVIYSAYQFHACSSFFVRYGLEQLLSFRLLLLHYFS